MKLQRIGIQLHDPHSPAASVSLRDGLTLVDAGDSRRALQLADLVGHLLYGARLVRDAGAPHEMAGYVDVDSPLGQYRLERHAQHVQRTGFSEPRLTIAPRDGHPAAASTTRDLLGGMSPEIAARLLVLHATGEGQLAWLLSEELATQLHRLENDGTGRLQATDTSTLGRLLTERDELSRQIEECLADRRRQSAKLEAELDELAAETRAAQQRLETDRQKLDGVTAELGELETRVRYHELATRAGQAASDSQQVDRQHALTELDEQITRWRRALADLETREKQVRGLLAQAHPDDSSPMLPLSDQRASVTVAARLVADLDSEVARYARPRDSQACLCQQTHARLHPLVDALSAQVEKLDRLISQYEAAIELQHMQAEAEHLSRSQVELRATIDQLLDRREAHLRTSRVRSTTPATDPLPADWPDRQQQLEAQRGELSQTVRRDEEQLAELQSRREQILRERTGLISNAVLGSLQQQLDQVMRRLNEESRRPSNVPFSTAPWRASDILAKLTDGRLREVRLSTTGREVAVVTRHGVPIEQRNLNDLDRRLVTISLQLAAVAGLGQWRLALPLLVANPFADLPAAQASILALVLHDFARAGHQVVIATGLPSVVDRLRAVGQAAWELGRHEVPDTAATDEPATSAPSAPRHTETGPAGEVFALRTTDAMEQFSVFGEETAQAFDAIGIRTVGDLLTSEPSDVSRKLDRTGISSAIVELWQAHAALLVFVPGLSLADAQLLTGAGVWDTAQLAESDPATLRRAIGDFLDSPHGMRHRTTAGSLTRERLAEWVSAARRHRQRWLHSPYADRWRARREAHEHRGAATADRAPRNGNSPPRPAATNGVSAPRGLRFRLSRRSPVGKAPSIGPKTEQRLTAAGIRTVGDLLTADAAQTAEELDVKHVTAETIVAWQHQAQLMCRIPELATRDAQLLVGCGFTTAEDIAAAEAADLLEFAKSHLATAEGARIGRAGPSPTLARAKKWIHWANHRRTLEAA